MRPIILAGILVPLFAGCPQQPHFSGTLQVEVNGPAETKVGLFRHPITADQVTVDTTVDGCTVITSLPAGSTTPTQRFDVVDGPFDITIDEDLPKSQYTLVAWIDNNGDNQLDFDRQTSSQEACTPAEQTVENGRRIIIAEIDVLTNPGAGSDPISVTSEAGPEGSRASIFDDFATGWVFNL